MSEVPLARRAQMALQGSVVRRDCLEKTVNPAPPVQPALPEKTARRVKTDRPGLLVHPEGTAHRVRRVLPGAMVSQARTERLAPRVPRVLLAQPVLMGNQGNGEQRDRKGFVVPRDSRATMALRDLRVRPVRTARMALKAQPGRLENEGQRDRRGPQENKVPPDQQGQRVHLEMPARRDRRASQDRLARRGHKVPKEMPVSPAPLAHRANVVHKDRPARLVRKATRVIRVIPDRRVIQASRDRQAQRGHQGRPVIGPGADFLTRISSPSAALGRRSQSTGNRPTYRSHTVTQAMSCLPEATSAVQGSASPSWSLPPIPSTTRNSVRVGR